MSNERLVLQATLDQKRRELEDCRMTADDITKTIINHIRPVAGTKFSYLDGINPGRLELQVKHLITQLSKKSTIEEGIKAIMEELGE